ncbi:MAG: Crp/Fnr family transcriptional regulator [Opitutaceae bacterium]|nr:Crp/Fnr family transcriptional regulator [Opitutaceae bacterium]
MSPGSACEAILFPIAGRIRVYQMGADGRAVTLYRIQPEEACVLSVAAVLGHQAFPALVETESGGEAWAVPASVFHQWVERHPFWRKYVFSLLAQRLGDVLAKFEAITFRRIDVRLAAWFLEAVHASSRVPCTHQGIADALGTAREVVSRTLADWQRAGWIRTGRGVVEVLRPAALATLAEKTPSV